MLFVLPWKETGGKTFYIPQVSNIVNIGLIIQIMNVNKKQYKL